MTKGVALGAALLETLIARGLLDLVEMDGSWGVHNPRYTQSLLERARDMVNAARSAGDEGEVDEPAPDDAGGG